MLQEANNRYSEAGLKWGVSNTSVWLTAWGLFAHPHNFTHGHGAPAGVFTLAMIWRDYIEHKLFKAINYTLKNSLHAHGNNATLHEFLPWIPCGSAWSSDPRYMKMFPSGLKKKYINCNPRLRRYTAVFRPNGLPFQVLSRNSTFELLFSAFWWRRGYGGKHSAPPTHICVISSGELPQEATGWN